MQFILARHGEKQTSTSIDYNERKNVCLTEVGIEQIINTAKYIQNSFDLESLSKFVYSSPYTRTLQSAEILRNELNLSEINAKQNLEEFYSSNNYSNPTEFRNRLKKKAYFNFNWISPETNTSINQQVVNFLDCLKEIHNQDSSENIIISSHSGIIRTTCYSLDSELKPKDKDILSALLHLGGITILEYSDGKFSVADFNVNTQS